MRQQNNGRRRQNRGSSRRSYGAGNNNGNINKNTVQTRLFRAKNLLKTNLKVEINNNGEAHG